jgi:hypothetical protein
MTGNSPCTARSGPRRKLRADKGRCRVALSDFDRLLVGGSKTDTLTERALFGRAGCLARSGDVESARRDLERYLAEFPAGQFAGRARTMLNRKNR